MVDAGAFGFYRLLLPNPSIQRLDRYLFLYAEAERQQKALTDQGVGIPEYLNSPMQRLKELSSAVKEIKEARQKHTV